MNFYRRSVPGAAGILKPLTASLAGKLWEFKRTTEMDSSFKQAKDALASAANLAHQTPSAELSLATDASSSHFGAVLQQRQNGGWAPLAFFSKKMTEPKCDIRLSTGNSWPLSSPSGIFVFFSRRDNFSCGRTTNPCVQLSKGSYLRGQQDSRGSWLTRIRSPCCLPH